MVESKVVRVSLKVGSGSGSDIYIANRECYTEMTCAHSACRWLMWVVWGFRADLSYMVSNVRVLSSYALRCHPPASVYTHS